MVLHECGGPEVLHLEGRPLPEPGEHDLPVEVRAASVNPVDAKVRYRNITVHYQFMGARVAYNIDPSRQGRILSGIAALVDRGLLTPHVSARFSLEQVAEAHRYIETGRTIGKIVVLVR